MIKYFAKEIATGKLIEARGQDIFFAGICYDTLTCWYVGDEDGPRFNVLYTDFEEYFYIIEAILV